VRSSSLGKGSSAAVLKIEKDVAPEMGGPGQTLLEAPPYRNAMVEETPARRRPPKPSFQRTLMYMMVFLTLFVLIDNNLRIAFGNAVGYVFGPTIGFGGAFPLLSLFLAGAFTTLISALSRHVFTDWVKMTRVNKKMRALQKAQMEALRRGNTQKMLEKTNTVFLLEVLLQRYVYGRPLELKSDRRIREAVLFLLDSLVETGSSAAFRMRDDFVTPAG